MTEQAAKPKHSPLPESAAPDPTVALARLFAAWAKGNLGTTPPFSREAKVALEMGLLSDRRCPEGWGCELTDLGKQALRIAEDGA